MNEFTNLDNIDPDILLTNESISSKYFSVSEYNQLLPGSLKLINQNIRSFRANLENFDSLLRSIKFSHDFIVITETWNTR